MVVSKEEKKLKINLKKRKKTTNKEMIVVFRVCARASIIFEEKINAQTNKQTYKQAHLMHSHGLCLKNNAQHLAISLTACVRVYAHRNICAICYTIKSEP